MREFEHAIAVRFLLRCLRCFACMLLLPLRYPASWLPPSSPRTQSSSVPDLPHHRLPRHRLPRLRLRHHRHLHHALPRHRPLQVARYKDGANDRGEGAMWSADRRVAWRIVRDGEYVEEISLEDAKAIADSVGEPVPARTR